MSTEYIEFIHEQSDWTTGSTFTDVSLNNRIISFQIVTENYFLYDGWYKYYRYEDDTKSTLIDKGKLFLRKSTDKTVYESPDEDKIIYNGW